MLNETQQDIIQTATVLANEQLCREHYRLSIRLPSFPPARPGQFLHLSPPWPEGADYQTIDWPDNESGGRPGASQSEISASARANEAHQKNQSTSPAWLHSFTAPMLRRAFSIAGLERSSDGCTASIIHRVVGKATTWLAGLTPGEPLSVMGPLGNAFPISASKKHAWMVAGGVGLPPMIWLAEALAAADRQAVAFCGAQAADLLALRLDPAVALCPQASRADLAAASFSRSGVPVVISTDDGSRGFRGYVGQTMAAYHQSHLVPADDLVVYTCGPERMMEAVAAYCRQREIECYVCMERNMACGTGMCQSCVVPVDEAAAADGWRYRLCCTEGPIFDARLIRWTPIPPQLAASH